MTKTNWELIGYVKRSDNRLRALRLLQTPMMPSELGKEMKISLTHASKIVRELNSKKMISCLNKNLKVGRIYQITKVGKNTIEKVQQITS